MSALHSKVAKSTNFALVSKQNDISQKVLYSNNYIELNWQTSSVVHNLEAYIKISHIALLKMAH